MRDVCSGSLGVIESFYGEVLNRRLIPYISRTPGDQLIELADRIRSKQLYIQRQLRLRQYSLDNTAAPPSDLPEGELIVHDQFYWEAPKGPRFADLTGFKHWYLLSDTLAVPDLLFGWADDLNNEERLHAAFGARFDPHELDVQLRAGLTRLVNLRPLVDAGGLVLLPGDHVLEVGEDANPLGMFTGVTDSVIPSDPLLASVILQKMKLMPGWEIASLDLGNPDDAIYLAERIIEDHDLTFGQVWRAAGFAEPYDRRTVDLALLHREERISPATGSKVTREYLLRSAAAALDGPDSPFRDSPADAAVKFGFPDMSTVSIQDLARLRKNEDVFYQCRNALRDLAEGVKGCRGEGFAEVQSEVSQLAEDLVRPTYDDLSRRSSSLRSRGLISGLAAGGAIGFILNGIATWIGGAIALGVRSVAGMASAQARAAVASSVSSSQSEVEIARGLLLSTLEEPVVEQSWETEA